MKYFLVQLQSNGMALLIKFQSESQQGVQEKEDPQVVLTKETTYVYDCVYLVCEMFDVILV